MSVPTPILQYNLSDASVKGLLPSGYTPLAYIESTGTLYIDTGAYFKYNSIIHAELSAIDNTGNYCFFGASNGTTYNTGDVSIWYSGTLFHYCYPTSNSAGNYYNLGNLSNNYDKLSVNITSSFCNVNSTRYDRSIPSDYVGTKTISLFCAHRSGYVNPSKSRIYIFTMYNPNGLLDVDLRPARRDSDGVIGMYDLVSRTFKTNSGSGTFIAGPELAIGKNGGKSLPEEYQLVEYLESTGALYIITNFIPDDTSGMYVKASCSTTGGNHIIGGSRESSGDTRFWINFSSNLELSWNTYASIYSYDSSVLEIENNYLNSRLGKVNGTTYRTNYPTLATITQPCYLFCGNSIGAVSSPFSGKIFNVKFSKNSTITHNFISCYRKSDMKPGMYDTVNGVFYTNLGSGEFILGPSINAGYTSEPNAGSGTLQGLYTNLSGIYDSSKGWAANFINNTAHLSSTIPAIGNNFSVAWWELSSDFNNSTMPWGIYPFNPLYSKCLNTADGSSNPWYKSGTTVIDNISNNVWHHFVVTGNGSANYLYVDGVKYGLSKTFKGLTGTSLVINGWQLTTSYCRNPKISNFQIFNVALTDAQVKELYGK